MNFSIPYTGIKAGHDRLAVSADNTARMIAPGSAKNRITHQDKQNGGVESIIQKIPLRDSNVDETGDDFIRTNIDYAEEAVNRELGSLTTKANSRVVETQESLLDSILDIKV